MQVDDIYRTIGQRLVQSDGAIEALRLLRAEFPPAQAAELARALASLVAETKLSSSSILHSFHFVPVSFVCNLLGNFGRGPGGTHEFTARANVVQHRRKMREESSIYTGI